MCGKNTFSYLIFVCAHTHTHTHTQIGGQLSGVGSLLPPCAFQGLCSCYQVWRQAPQVWWRAPLPTEAPHQPGLLVLKACPVSLTALCTVLRLTERLFLDHPHRLTNSKVQYVSPLSPCSHCLGCVAGVAVDSPTPDSQEHLCMCVCRQYYRVLVAVLLSRTWHVRRQAQQTVRKLLSSLGGVKLANGLLDELKTVLNSHKVRIRGL